MKKNIIFVGLDVHKNSVDVALADAGRDGEVRFSGSIGGDLESLQKVIRKLQSTSATLRFVYSGGTVKRGGITKTGNGPVLFDGHSTLTRHGKAESC